MRTRSKRSRPWASTKSRSALRSTCETRYGLCAKCYGRDLGRGQLVNVGEAVGVIAAQSIGEPGTQLTMRTFHIGGAASRTAVASQLESKSSGTVRFSPLMRYVTNPRGEPVAISRSGEVVIVDDNGRERERHKVPYGATLTIMDGAPVKAGKVLAGWDPHTRPIITEFAGRIKFENVEEGVTVAKQIDEVTGSVHSGGDRSQASRGRSGEGVATERQADRRQGQGGENPRHRIAGEHHLPDPLDHHGEGRPTGAGRRGAGPHPAGNVQDSGYHRRSAACRGIVRGSLSEGRRSAGGDHRYRFVRQGHQGQAAAGHHRSGQRGRTST